MLKRITRNWWLFAVRGVVAVIFGLVALARPEQTMQAMVLVFGVFALVDGAFSVIASLSSAPFFGRWWALLLEGTAGILVGLMAIFLPDITGRALLYTIAAWALVTGVFEIVAAFQLRRVLTGEWVLILSGLLSMLFGVLLFVFPGAGAVSLVWLIGVYAILFGITLVILAFRLRSLWKEFETTTVPN
jgi:uncharacterized membrane protein HdeD (DUF308 family)